MGLAPYGEPEYAEAIRDIIRPTGRSVRVESELLHAPSTCGIRMSWNDGAPIVQPFHSEKLVRALGPMRRPDEPMTEEA